MVYTQRKAKRPGETHDRVRVLLGDLASEQGNVVRVFKDQDSVARCIVFATRHMRQFFQAFPEMMLIDATYGTNDAHYKLFSMMVTDVFGHGRFIQHALIDSENKVNMASAIEAFKDCNPEWSDKLKVLMVRSCVWLFLSKYYTCAHKLFTCQIDKDFSEISVLREHCPQQRLLLCHFHALKHVKTIVNSAVYQLNDTYMRNQVQDLFKGMLYAASERQ